MKERIAFFAITLIFYIAYFKILQWGWDKFIPFNRISNIIVLFILVVVNIPLSLISAEKTIRLIKAL